MASKLSCLLVANEVFPEAELSASLAPDFFIAEYDYASSLSEAFQSLLNSNFNLCLIDSCYQEELAAFFRDMTKLGRDKTCAFVRIADSKEKKLSPAGLGFCAKISRNLHNEDIQILKSALSHEVVRILEQQKGNDIPKYVELVLKEIDQAARKKQRGLDASFDRVIAGLVKDMMSDISTHKEGFISELASASEKFQGFESTTIDVPDKILEKNLPKLDRTKYIGRSDRVWKMLLKKFGDKP